MKASKELKIGIFVVLVLVISFFIINFLREKDIFNRQMEVSALYRDVEGLTTSSPVYIKGFKAGSVTDIGYDAESGYFNVTCSFSKDFVLPADSRMVIYSVDIMGGKGVRIEPGTSGDRLADGDVIYGETVPDMLSSLGEEADPLIAGLTRTVDSLNIAVSNINNVLDAANRERIASSLLHLERTLANAEKVTSVLDGRQADIDEFISNLKNVSLQLMSVMEKADTAMTDISATTSALAESDIMGMTESLKNVLDAIQNPDGTVGRLLNDGDVYDSLDSLISDISSLVRKIEENPKKYVRISVF